MAETLLYIGLGVLVGILGGLVGIGGGVAVVPILVFVCKMSQHEAQGTSLGMLLPPIGLFAVITYYRAGYINLRIACLMAAGFMLGGLLGAKVATAIDGTRLRRVFGIFMLLVSLKMIFGVDTGDGTTEPSPRTAPAAAATVTESGS